MKRNLYLVVIAVLLAAAVVFHTEISTGILAAGKRCVLVLIPSLYFYSILAGVCTGGGLLGRSGKSGLAAVLIFSQLGGYPFGAQLLYGMYRSGRLSEVEMRRMLCVCVGCGPGFLLGTVCSRMQLRVGMWMLLSVSLPNLLCGLLMLRSIKLQSREIHRRFGVQLLTGAVEGAAGAMLKICGMVLAMAALMAIGEGAGLFRCVGQLYPKVPELAAAFFRTAAEVSCISEWAAQGGSLPMAAALLAFGGICVHLQIAAICDGMMPWIRFWCIRLVCSVMAYGLCSIGIRWLFPDVLTVSLFTGSTAPEVTEGSIVPGMCMLVMSVLVLKKHHRLFPQKERSV